MYEEKMKFGVILSLNVDIYLVEDAINESQIQVVRSPM